MSRYQHTDTQEAQEQKTASSNIINRREIEPLLLKAHRVVDSYEKATDCTVALLDQTGNPIKGSHQVFCDFCKKNYLSSLGTEDAEDYPCLSLHIRGVTEAQRMGGSYIYVCDMGFIFWASPIYSTGRFAGALIAGKVLSGELRQEAEKIYSRLQGKAEKAEIADNLKNIPVRTAEEIKALAKILLVCSEQISKTTEDYIEIIKRRDEQNSHAAPQAKSSQNQRGKKNDFSGYSLDKERQLLAALRRGDNETGKKILNQLLENLFTSNPHNFDFIKLRAIELVVLLSRETITPDTNEDNTQLEKNNRYIRYIQETQNIEELTDVMATIVERMSGQIFSFQGVRHASALRKAERYIWENYTRKICLQEVADASGLSAPYFSTIFKEEMGENLSNYLNRLRVEKASSMLTETSLPLNEIAGACGFEDQSWFSKIFKTYAGISPGKYRETGGNINSFPQDEGRPYPAAL
ncbi:MAG: PocR ligand-binding domain-containing protein [Spirochaetaceae bacterium]|jgi:AraC-like DNA-binding protein/ligand-binding sensor protein|nr:PocR ligand-binding domain-containing protein [Spirochaetaceae bacterium]